MQHELKDIRDKLDTIDRDIVLALARRLALVREVGDRKRRAGARVRDPAREQRLLESVSASAESVGLDPQLVMRLYGAILDHSVRVQEDLVDAPALDQIASIRVAYQGASGSYSSQAARQHFAAWSTGAEGRALELHGLRTFHEVQDAVLQGEVDCGVLPIENTTVGSIHAVYDLLGAAALTIIGEEVLRVDHCLLAREPMPLAAVRRVRSQTPALDQCRVFLSSLRDVIIEPYEDTAAAARSLVDDPARGEGLTAIASSEAARRYGLHIVKRSICDQPDNYTRFVVVTAGTYEDARRPRRGEQERLYKTTALLTTRHEPGALARCLEALALHGLDLVRLESRPLPGRPWQYGFHLDLIGDARLPRVRAALEATAERAVSLRVLGSYPARVAIENMSKET